MTNNFIQLTNFEASLLKQAKQLFDLSLKFNIKISTAESCTGGLISALITEIDGSSKIFDRGFVVYSNLAKIQNLNVEAQTLEKFGAVSEEVAGQMAIGAIKNSVANLSVATTGVAGSNSSEQKPVGLVYISSFNQINQKLLVKKFNFTGNRQQNRALTVQNAMKMLIEQIKSSSLS